MKKLLVILLALTLVLAFAACGNSEEPAGEEQTPETEEVVNEEETAETNEEAAGTEADTESDVLTEAALNYFASFPDTRHVIDAESLIERVKAGEELFILDIRSAEDYAAGHIQGAYNVPYADVPTVLDQLPNDVEIFVNCYSGQTSSQTVALLNIAGKFATNVQSGFNNGISQVAGYEEVISTEATPLPEGDYPVDETIKAAITDYYADAASNTFRSFNISAEQVKELVDAGSTDYTILSVRSAEDYAAGHIAGAINIPFGAGMQESFSQIPTDKPVIVYCYTGQTASQVLGVLRMLGYEAYNMSGGMTNGWLAAGYEVVTE